MGQRTVSLRSFLKTGAVVVAAGVAGMMGESL